MSQIGRRQFLTAAGALLAAPHVSRANTSTKLPVLGFLSPGAKVPPKALQNWLFFKHLRELGWVEGKTLRVEYAFSGKNLGLLRDLAVMLVAKKVDVIWTASPWGAVAAAQATSTVPIVFWRVAFPQKLGIIDSLARPGRNVTGVAWFADATIFVKRIELLREVAPDAVRVALLSTTSTFRDVSDKVVDVQWLRDKFDATMSDLGFVRQRFVIEKPSDFETAFAAIEKWGADSMIVTDVPLTINARKQIVDFARQHNLVDMYYTNKWVEAGGLVAYGIVLNPTLLRTADMVDRILRGAKPADIPVELPSEYELVVNLKTAEALGLTISPSFMLRVDRVIE